MKKYFILIIGIIFLTAVVSGCTSTTNVNEFRLVNSAFLLSGNFKEIWHSSGSELVERVRLDSSDKSIIVSQYMDKALYQRESKDAVAIKTINGTKCKFIPGKPAEVWFEKNGKFYAVEVQDFDFNKNLIEGTSDDDKYIEEIIVTLN